jgi:hypothetical protein
VDGFAPLAMTASGEGFADSKIVAGFFPISQAPPQISGARANLSTKTLSQILILGNFLLKFLVQLRRALRGPRPKASRRGLEGGSRGHAGGCRGTGTGTALAASLARPAAQPGTCFEAPAGRLSMRVEGTESTC